MHGERPYVLTIAGFDPTNGAGLTADVKTFEQNRVYGLAVCTCLTLQTEDRFYSAEWRDEQTIHNEITVLLEKYPVRAVKFGIVPSIGFISGCISVIKKINPAAQIVIDPVWKSSTGFPFADFTDLPALEALLKQTDLLTPNREELKNMAGGNNPESFVKVLCQYSPILLKGGHTEGAEKGIDVFYDKNHQREIKPNAFNVSPKHGSGCVLSAAITAHLALGYDVFDACVNGKRYTEHFLSGNHSLLGYHVA